MQILKNRLHFHLLSYNLFFMTKLTVEVTVNSPIQKVWEVWTTPEHITKWCSGDESWHTPSASNDLQVGGKFVTRMEARDGSMGFDFEGVYTKVIENNEIHYAMEDGREVEIYFEEQEDGVKVTEIFDAEDIHSHELQIAGWQHILHNFKKHIESL